MKVMQRQGLCEISRYGEDPQCLQRPGYVTCVQSAHTKKIHEGIDFVCAGHRLLILERKRALYRQYGLAVPFMWCRKIKEGK